MRSTEGLKEAIAGLPQQQREAVELLKLRELSLAEASQVSGKSLAALKVNVHRAIKSLRLRLKGEVKRVADTSTLIKRLVDDAKPVKRLRPPALRAGLWLLAVGAAGAAAILLFANLAVFFERIGGYGASRSNGSRPSPRGTRRWSPLSS